MLVEYLKQVERLVGKGEIPTCDVYYTGTDLTDFYVLPFHISMLHLTIVFKSLNHQATVVAQHVLCYSGA